jgi:hypothetical protein
MFFPLLFMDSEVSDNVVVFPNPHWLKGLSPGRDAVSQCRVVC